MAQPDPSLGIAVDFPSQQFRAAVRFAMQMGAHTDPALRPTFVFAAAGARTYTKRGIEVVNPRLDRDGNPLDPDIAVSVTKGNEVQVDCAIEVQRADADEIPVGNFRQTKAVITLLDTDYPKVKGCRELRYNGDRYAFGYEPEAPALFDVNTYTLIFYAIDES